MILACFYDLRIFMAIFLIMLCFFGACFNVLAINPQPEYRELNKFLRNILNALRISLGDNHYAQLDSQTSIEDKIYWGIWTLTFIMACLIFLNFIIAEVCNSYQVAKDNIDSYIYIERAKMIKEVEEFLPAAYKKTR